MKKIAALLTALVLVLGTFAIAHASQVDEWAMEDAVTLIVNTAQIYKQDPGPMGHKLDKMLVQFVQHSKSLAWYKEHDPKDLHNYIMGLAGVATYTWQMLQSGQVTPDYVMSHPAQILEIILMRSN